MGCKQILLGLFWAETLTFGLLFEDMGNFLEKFIQNYNVLGNILLEHLNIYVHLNKQFQSIICWVKHLPYNAYLQAKH